MRVLVCGGRDYNDVVRITQALDKLRAKFGDFTVVQGGARGADTLAKWWALSRNVACEEYPAQWDKYGKSAGYKRNALMADTLDTKTDCVVAFPGGKGTKNMVDLARARGIKVYVVNP